MKSFPEVVIGSKSKYILNFKIDMPSCCPKSSNQFIFISNLLEPFPCMSSRNCVHYSFCLGHLKYKYMSLTTGVFIRLFMFVGHLNLLFYKLPSYGLSPSVRFYIFLVIFLYFRCFLSSVLQIPFSKFILCSLALYMIFAM